MITSSDTRRTRSRPPAAAPVFVTLPVSHPPVLLANSNR